MSLKCLIVDDEPLAIEIIETYLGRFPNVKIEGKCGNAIKALELLRTKKIDLMFLDIQMPQITGTDFLKSLSNPPKVIFTTAYRDYAIDGFELNAIDYLLKPISFERFIKAMDKVFSIIVPDESNYTTINSENEREYLFIKVDRKMTKIFIDEVVYLESLKDYVVFHLRDKKFITKNTISYFEELLSDINFLRVHRSYIVSVKKVIAFSSSEIELSNSKKLPIGRNYQKGTIIILNNLIN